jgi:ABC-type transport system involved in cytochrome c biogenesis permease subunit
MPDAGAEFSALAAALLLYVAAGLVALTGIAWGRRHEPAVLALLACGLAVHAASLGLRWERVGHGPFITLFEALSSNIWSLALVYTIAYWRVRAVRPAAAIVLPVLFVMIAWLAIAQRADGHLPPTYQTGWLWVHVGFGKVFLGSVLVAVGLAGVLLLRTAAPGRGRFARLPGDAALERLAFRFMVLGFLFETLMLVAGAIWAQDAWGRYWAWDPLETWAFLTWLALGFFIHLRASYRIAPKHAAYAIISIFVLAFLTFFGVPFVSTVPHQGAI